MFFDQFQFLFEFFQKLQAPRFSIGSVDENQVENLINNHHHHNHHHHHHHHHHLNIKDSFSHLKNTLKRSASYHSKIEEESDVESFLIMVGIIPSLDRPGKFAT